MKKITKEELFELNNFSFMSNKREYEIIDDDGFFTRVVPRFITGRTTVHDGAYIRRKSDMQNMGTEVRYWIQYMDSDFNYYPDGYMESKKEDYEIVLPDGRVMDI